MLYKYSVKFVLESEEGKISVEQQSITIDVAAEEANREAWNSVKVLQDFMLSNGYKRCNTAEFKRVAEPVEYDARCLDCICNREHTLLQHFVSVYKN